MSHHGAYVRALDGQCVSLRESCNIDRPVVLECRRYLCSVGDHAYVDIPRALSPRQTHVLQPRRAQETPSQRATVNDRLNQTSIVSVLL